MKTILAILIVLLLTGQIFGQTNLIPNGSFETYTSCPSKINDLQPDQIAKASGWYAIKGTPDYFNACSTNTAIGTATTNFFGDQAPNSGVAYMGLWCYQNNSNPPYREYISAKLTSTLLIGQKYFVKLSVSSAEGYISNGGIDKLGLKFSTVKQPTLTNAAINNYAHVSATTVITNTLSWTTVFKSFIADSNYQYVEIGNFFDDANTNFQAFRTGGNWSYFYVDDVCTSTDSLFALNWTPTLITEINDHNRSTFGVCVFPNPCSNFFHVENVQGAVATELQIFNTFGKLVSSITNSYEMDISALSDGLYFIKVIYADRTYYKNIVVRH